MSHWYALHCKPHNEAIVHSQLVVAAVETFYPTYRAPRPGASPDRSLFPGYLFARVEPLEMQPHLFRWLPGLIGVVAFDGHPAPISDAVINYLRDRAAAVVSAGGPALLNIQPGDPVRIVAGPFNDLDAIFDAALDGRARVRVLLDVLGRLSRVELPAAAIARVPPGAAPSRPDRFRHGQPDRVHG
jgi:transcriptional antiterminator RfaH